MLGMLVDLPNTEFSGLAYIKSAGLTEQPKISECSK